MQCNTELTNSWWCPDHAICMEWIDRRAAELIENFHDVDSVYMSLDVYAQFVKQLASVTRHVYSNPDYPVAFNIVTHCARLTVKPITGFENFCHVGTDLTYNDLVRIQIDQMFEDIAMKGFDKE